MRAGQGWIQEKSGRWKERGRCRCGRGAHKFVNIALKLAALHAQEVRLTAHLGDGRLSRAAASAQRERQKSLEGVRGVV